MPWRMWHDMTTYTEETMTPNHDGTRHDNLAVYDTRWMSNYKVHLKQDVH